MKKLFLVLILTSCAGSPYLQRWDARTNELSICCSKSSCHDADFESVSDKLCVGHITAIGGSIETASSVGYMPTNSYNYSTMQYSSGGVFVPTRISAPCKQYHCDGTILAK